MAFYIIYHRFATVRVRRPIGFRPPSNQIPFAVRSDSVRRTMTYAKLLRCQPLRPMPRTQSCYS